MHKKKEKYMIFSKRTQLHIVKNLRIMIHDGSCNGADICGCTQLDKVSYYRYLGLLIQDDLKYNEHIHMVCNKITSELAVLNSLRQITSTSLRRMVYFALVESHIRYMLPLYKGTFKTTTDLINCNNVQFYPWLRWKTLQIQLPSLKHLISSIFINCTTWMLLKCYTLQMAVSIDPHIIIRQDITHRVSSQ